MYVILMAIGVCEVPSYVVLHKLDEIGNNVSFGIGHFTTRKQKIPVTKCYPQ